MAEKSIIRGWMPLKVVDIVDETHDTKTFVFENLDTGSRVFDFIAGQYLTFRYDGIIEKPVVRSYTMSGSPSQSEATYVTVKRVELGLVSNWMCDKLQIGDVLKARGPIGKFCYFADQDTPHLFMVAGGSGVTPFTSIIREYAPLLGQAGAPQSLNLLVAFRTSQDLINWNVLGPLRQMDGINIQVTLTRENHPEFLYGRPTEEMLSNFFVNRYAEATVMSCGPDAIMEQAVEHAKRHGVDTRFIKTESFS